MKTKEAPSEVEIPGNVRRTSRRRFLKTGAAGLAGAALLGVAGCGGGEKVPVAPGAWITP